MATTDMARKAGGGAAVPLSVGAAGSKSNSVACAEAYLHTKWHLILNPSICLATIHQLYKTGRTTVR